MSLLYLLCHNPEDLKHLHHYPHRDILHRICHRHLDIFLKPYEEILDLLEDDDEFIVARNNALCRLYGVRIRSLRDRETQDDSYRNEDTSTSENGICWWEYLDI